MVRPLLDYCCFIWSPFNKNDIKALENVQYFALKMATQSWKVHYNDLLGKCTVPSLSSRRSYFDCCLVFKILSDLSCIPTNHFVPIVTGVIKEPVIPVRLEPPGFLQPRLFVIVFPTGLCPTGILFQIQLFLVFLILILNLL
jgi:hypothetical protein